MGFKMNYLNNTKIPSPYIRTKTQGFIPDVFIQDSFLVDLTLFYVSVNFLWFQIDLFLILSIRMSSDPV